MTRKQLFYLCLAAALALLGSATYEVMAEICMDQTDCPEQEKL